RAAAGAGAAVADLVDVAGEPDERVRREVALEHRQHQRRRAREVAGEGHVDEVAEDAGALLLAAVAEAGIVGASLRAAERRIRPGIAGLLAGAHCRRRNGVDAALEIAELVEVSLEAELVGAAELRDEPLGVAGD